MPFQQDHSCFKIPYTLGDIQSLSLKTLLGHAKICPKLQYMLIYSQNLFKIN